MTSPHHDLVHAMEAGGFTTPENIFDKFQIILYSISTDKDKF